VAVQARELNVLGGLLQNQIESFGDNIYQAGTIISGVNFSYDAAYAYAKLNDIDYNGLPVIPSNYVGLYATNQNGVKATVVNSLNGFQATDPYLKTIYLEYISAGTTGQPTFSSGDLVRISDLTNSIYNIVINTPGSTYSNQDTLVFCSCISVTNVVGSGYQIGELISQPGSNTRATILSVNNSIYSDRSVLFIAPYATDLANTILSLTPWVFANNVVAVGGTTGTVASVIDVIGKNAQGTIITDGAGRIIDTIITDAGSDYRVAPTVTVKPAINPSAVSSGLSMTAWNYLQDVYVASTSNSVGIGYAMSVSSGIIYQKGYFIQVNPQVVIVEPYDPSPNNLSVIFTVQENIITPDIDPLLFDNALGQPNYIGYGANRMQLLPTLAIVNTDFIEQQTDYMILTSFSEGLAWRQNQYTQFNSIETEMANRMNDADGNFSLSPFHDTTRSPINPADGNTISLIVEPGKAYISGYLVQVDTNFSTEIPKGTSLAYSNNTYISLAYDNYIQITELGGYFGFNIGDTVNFYDSPKGFLSNTQNIYEGNTYPYGNFVGTASMRSMTLSSGIPGTNTAIYNLYIFNLNIAAGKNFNSAKSASYNNGKGIADIILTFNATTQTDLAKVQGNNSTLVFNPSTGPIQQVSNVVYTYRSVNTMVTVSNLGTASLSLVANPNESFPYTGGAALTNVQMQDLIVTPLSNNFVWSTPITGTVSINGTSANMIGVGTSFTASLSPGDYVTIANALVTDVHQIISIANDTVAIMESNSTVGTLVTANVCHYMPPNASIPFGSRTWLSANLSSNAAILTLNFGSRFAGTATGNLAIVFNAIRTNVSPGTKNANRGNFIVINTSNHSANSIGPWCVGVPDVVRMRGAWLVNSSQTNTGPGATDVSQSFYIDNNQDADFVGQCYLYRTPASAINLQNVFILCEFDYANPYISGFYSTDSYTTANANSIFYNDMLTTDQLGSQLTTWEIPEFTDQGTYYDMMQWIDFRPVAPITANLQTVTYNPYSSSNVNISKDYKFPVPGSSLTANISYYLPRIDAIVIDTNEDILDIQGAPDNNPTAPSTPNNSLLIDQLLIPAYPDIPQNPSAAVINAITTSMGSGSPNMVRINSSMVTSVISTAPSQSTQPQGYTMADIGELERRIAALEYYVSLNSLEVLITQQAIPSSVAANVNRFQYGFYADDFSTTDFANTADPEWAATVYTDRDQCFPKSDIINLPHELIGFPAYVEFPYVNQPLASYPPLPPVANVPVANVPVANVPVANVPVANVPVANVPVSNVPVVNVPVVNTPVSNVPVQNVGPPQPCNIVSNTIITQTGGHEHCPGKCNDVCTVHLCNVNYSNCVLYYCGQGNHTICQGNDENHCTTVVATPANCQPVTANDVSKCKSDQFLVSDCRHSTNVAPRLTQTKMVCFMDGTAACGKIEFSHDASQGTCYQIHTGGDTNCYKCNTTPATPTRTCTHWKYQVTYPVASNTNVDCANTGGTPPPPPNPCPNVQSNTVSYPNVCSNSSQSNNHPCKKSCDVDRCQKTCNDPDPCQQPTETCVSFKESGCKPNHTYSCFVDQQNCGAQCKPKPVAPSNNCVVVQNTCGQVGDPICSDANGHCDFDLYWSERQQGTGNNNCMTNYEECPQKVPVCTQTGTKTCTIQDITDTTQPPRVRTFNCTYPQSNAAATPCSNNSPQSNCYGAKGGSKGNSYNNH
jgi:hypothetical protein